MKKEKFEAKLFTKESNKRKQKGYLWKHYLSKVTKHSLYKPFPVLFPRQAHLYRQ